MLSSPAVEALADAVAAGGLIPPRSTGVILVSGGADSACAAAALTALCGPASIAALHVNYGLRADSGDDEAAARALCAKLRIDLHVERPALGAGNLQARAREARYAAAERLRLRLEADWIATGHTRSDVAETMLYRLVASPGTRALLGLAPRSGAIVRPLYAIAREETRAVAEEAGLPYSDDPSNASPRYARNRIRNEVLPVLSAISPEAVRNMAATHAELHEEAELLADLVEAELERAGAGGGETAIGADALAAMRPGLARLTLRELAGRAAGRPVPLSRSRAAEVVRLASHPEGGRAELGGGVVARCERGRVELLSGPTPAGQLEPARMSVPGVARFGEWELRADLRPAPVTPAGPELATLDAAALGGEVEVRSWRSGDRIRPLGLGGSKSLADLFADRGVPRSQRGRIPVVTARGRIAWVAGLAVAEEFRLSPASSEIVVLRARMAPSPAEEPTPAPAGGPGSGAQGGSR